MHMCGYTPNYTFMRTTIHMPSPSMPTCTLWQFNIAMENQFSWVNHGKSTISIGIFHSYP